MKKGFTLVELLIVMAVIAILATGLIVGLNPVEKIRQANDTKAIAQGSEVAKAVNRFVANNATGMYPKTVAELQIEMPGYPTAGYTNVAFTPNAAGAAPTLVITLNSVKGCTPSTGSAITPPCGSTWDAVTGQFTLGAGAPACVNPGGAAVGTTCTANSNCCSNVCSGTPKKCT